MKLQVRVLVPAVALALVLITAPLGAIERAEFINGSQWTQWPHQDKLVYIRGLCNWADFVTEAQIKAKKNYEYCISKVFVDQLKNKSLGEVVEQVNAYYQEDPKHLNTSVVEAIMRRSTKVCPR